MTLFSVAIPAIKGYLDAKGSAFASGWCRSSQKMGTVLFWLIAVMGVFFALSGLYEYFNTIYTPVYAKGYMAGACFTLSIGGWALTLIVQGVISFFQKSKTPTVSSDSLEEQAKHLVKVIQTDGTNLVKQHPFAAILIGLSVGLLSGMVPFSKQK